jgi:Domain of unknown function (DUF222)
MTQPSSSGRGPGPSGGPGAGRDPRLGWFADGAPGNACVPSGGLAEVLEDLGGAGWRCAGTTDDELTGMLGRWQAVASWAEAAKLGLVRELIRRAALPGHPAVLPGDLPDAWEDGLAHEVALVLGCSLQAADKIVILAWDLEARLPGIGALLADGTLDIVKVRVIADEFRVLDDEHAAEAEKLLLDELYRLEGQAGLTAGKLGRIAQRVTDSVDPEGARKRRERAEREEARVRFWRDHGGAAGMVARGLPADEALMANAAIDQRAKAYKKEKVCPGARLDQLRVLALLDMLNGVGLQARITRAAAGTAAAGTGTGTPPGAGTAGHSGASDDGRDEGRDDDDPGDGGPGTDDPYDDGPGDDGGDDGGPGASGPDGGPGDGGPGGGGGRDDTLSGAGPAAGAGEVPDPGLAAHTNLTLPLVTLLDLAERPGEAHGLGSLDPALCRDLANAAARSPDSEFCVTVTDHNGYAIGHGCARRPRTTGKKRTTGKGQSPGGGRDGPPPRTWAFTRCDATGPPGGYGTWLLTLPSGGELIVELGPVPVDDCDHRHESQAYKPNDTLRHLVQVRDGDCTFPCCSRHARDSDFEHAVPYGKGGRTCACNAGARSRRCHRVKQSEGWTVTQPRPGWHQWRTPSGRTYTQGPKRYPA